MRNRDMFYQNYSASGFNIPNQGQFMPQNPSMMQSPNMMMPNGFDASMQMSAYGPNVVPEQMSNYNNYDNYFEQRISRLEKQIKSLDTRVQKLESGSVEINEDVYII